MQQEETAPRGGFRDRRKGLVVYGALAIMVGALSALVALFALVATVFSPAGAARPADVRSILLAVLIYGALAIVFIWSGVGSIRAQRWVRPIMLVVAWTWLVFGVAALAFWLLLLPDFQAAMSQAVPAGADLPEEALTVVTALASVLLLLVYVVLPALFVWFYQSADVKATLERHDPVTRWTDRCPPPVLGLSLGLWYSAAGCLLMIVYGAVPIFGVVLTGLPAAGVLAGSSGVLAVLGRATYRLSMAGWWGSFALSVVVPVGSIMTLTRIELLEIYRRMGFPPDQLEMMRQYRALSSTSLIVWTSILGAVFIAYTLWIRRFFLDRGPAS